jgi:hypothetical protein
VLAGDVKGIFSGGLPALAEIVIATHSGLTTDDFEAVARDWIAKTRHPKTKLFTEMVFQAMVELLAYLRANGFKTFIVSGGGVEFMRTFAEVTYGVPPEQVIGSSGKLKFEMRDGEPVDEACRSSNLLMTTSKNPQRYKNTSAVAPSHRSAIPMAISKCCNGRPPERARTSRCSFTTPTLLADGPTIGNGQSPNSIRPSMRPMRKAGRSSI